MEDEKSIQASLWSANGHPFYEYRGLGSRSVSIPLRDNIPGESNWPRQDFHFPWCMTQSGRGSHRYPKGGPKRSSCKDTGVERLRHMDMAKYGS